MNRRLAIGSILVLALSTVAARAEPQSRAQIEISNLLAYIAGSGCEVNRNGIWYGPKTALYHLRGKYEDMKKLNLINTAEDFIDRVATVSEAGDQPYQVRCAGHPLVTSNQWLGAELAHLRIE